MVLYILAVYDAFCADGHHPMLVKLHGTPPGAKNSETHRRYGQSYQPSIRLDWAILPGLALCNERPDGCAD